MRAPVRWGTFISGMFFSKLSLVSCLWVMETTTDITPFSLKFDGLQNCSQWSPQIGEYPRGNHVSLSLSKPENPLFFSLTTLTLEVRTLSYLWINARKKEMLSYSMVGVVH